MRKRESEKREREREREVERPCVHKPLSEDSRRVDSIPRAFSHA
jgi:hypothetical protein